MQMQLIHILDESNSPKPGAWENLLFEIIKVCNVPKAEVNLGILNVSYREI